MRPLALTFSLAFLSTTLQAAELDKPGESLPPAVGESLAQPPDPACGSACDCCEERPARFYATGEYLLWWLKASPVPVPMLTASSDPINNPRAILGNPATSVLFGGRNYDQGAFSGGRLTAGWQVSDTFGVEGSGFMLQQKTRSFGFRSDAVGNPVLATPFFDAVANQPFSSFYSLPTPDGGSAAFSFDLTTRVWGAEANLTANVVENDRLRIRALTGFRYLELAEKLRMIDQAIFFGPTFIFDQAVIPAPGTFPAFDEFATKNQFYGGQIGADVEANYGKFTFGMRTKVALGSMRQVLAISGATASIPPGGTTSVLTVPGDSFALISNIGRYGHNEFAVVPEVSLNVGYQVTRAINVFVGYNFLYVSQVLRPGDQVDPRWNPALIPTFGLTPSGPRLPAPLMNQSDWYAHGLNFGVGVRF